MEGTKVSPLLYLGIFIFVIPIITNIFRWHLPGWISGFGMFILIVGVIHSAYLTLKGEDKLY